MGRRLPLVACVLFVLPALAGCITGEDEAAPASASASPSGGSHAVIAVIDSGINAYHEQFRDDSPEAYAHPSTYIEGYPADAPALELTFDAPDWASAVAADCEKWNALEPDRVYWIPGTRIIGLRVASAWTEFTDIVDCAAGEIPQRGLDAYVPHGTGASGRAAGATTSLCPECKIVMSQAPHVTPSMTWPSEQSWIDVQSNSWGGYLCDALDRTQLVCGKGPRELAEDATARQVTFAASGNGIRFRSGLVGLNLGVGMPPHLKPAQGHAGVIVVGGHDNGEVILWPGTMPHVVADAFAHPSAAWNATAGGVFGGTSGATPFAAGAFASMLLEARRMVADPGTGLRDGDLVVAADTADLPASGPLADGRLDRAEAERLFMLTARPRPLEDQPFDGELGCPPGECVRIGRSNNLGPWETIPEDVPAYYFIGYGQVGSRSFEDAMAVLRGDASAPERPVEDRFFEADERVREEFPL